MSSTNGPTDVATSYYSAPPSPDDAWEIQRWEATRLRRRMLTGQWSNDLRMYVSRALGIVRASAIGPLVETGGNLFASVVATLSTLYTVEPVIGHADPIAVDRMTRLLEGAGYASTMSEVQRLTLGLREMLVHVTTFPTGDPSAPIELALRPVYPDLITARPHPRHPSIPISVREAMQVVDDSGRIGWIWNEATADPSNPRSVIPYILYHASIGSTLYDHTAWAELVDGTMSAACNRTAAAHNLRFAAWSQRVLIDARLPSDEIDGRAEVVTDPSTVVQVDSVEGKQAQYGQWAQPFSPSEFADAISRSEETLALMAGIPAADVLRTNSDSRSGVSLQIDREGKREVARRFEPTFRRADLQLLRTIAVMANDALGDPSFLPESGWSISYRSQPPTEDEINATQDRILGQLDRGLISKVEARSKLTGETLDDAAKALAAIAAGGVLVPA